MNTEWYVNGVYLPGENDYSGMFAIDPEYTRSISGPVEIKALVYDKNWAYKEYHTWNVTLAKLNTSISAPDVSSPWGKTITLSATLTSGGTGLNAKTLYFYVNGSLCGTATTNTSGYASRSCTAPGTPGTATIRVDFQGDTQYNSSTDNANWNVQKRVTDVVEFTVNGSLGPVTVYVGDNVRFQARLRDVDNGYTGVSGRTMRFERKLLLSWPMIGSGTTNASGYAIFDWTAAVAPLYSAEGELVGVKIDKVQPLPDSSGVSFTVTEQRVDSTGKLLEPQDAQDWRAKFDEETYYFGDISDYNIVINVLEKPSTNVSCPNNGTIPWGKPLTWTSRLTSNGAGLASKELRLYRNSIYINSVYTDGNGYASFSPTISDPDNYTMCVQFPGDNGYKPSQCCFTLTVQKHTTDIVEFTANGSLGPVTVNVGDNVRFRARLRDVDNGYTGVSGRTMRFERKLLLSWPMIGSGTTDASGYATFDWTAAVAPLYSAEGELVGVKIDKVQPLPDSSGASFTVTEQRVDSTGKLLEPQDAQDWRAKFDVDSHYLTSYSPNEIRVDVQEVYNITGRLTTGTAPGGCLAGVTITDGIRNAVTSSDGRYTIENVPSGQYSVGPSSGGGFTVSDWDWSPGMSRPVTVTDGNVTGVDFTASCIATPSVQIEGIPLYYTPGQSFDITVRTLNIGPSVNSAAAYVSVSFPQNPSMQVMSYAPGATSTIFPSGSQIWHWPDASRPCGDFMTSTYVLVDGSRSGIENQNSNLLWMTMRITPPVSMTGDLQIFCHGAIGDKNAPGSGPTNEQGMWVNEVNIPPNVWRLLHLETLMPGVDEASEVMLGGTALRYYLISDPFSQAPVAGVEVFSKTNSLFVSNSDGIICIEANLNDLGWNSIGTYTWDLLDRVHLPGQIITFDAPLQFDVEVKPREFEKNWDLLAKVTADGGIGVGVGLGPLGIRAARASVGGSAGLGGSITAKISTSAPTWLIYSRRIETSAGVGLSVGRIPALSFANIRVGAGIGASLMAQGHQAFSFDDPFNQDEQIVAQGALFLETGSRVGASVFSPVSAPVLNGFISYILDHSQYATLINQSQDELGASLGL